MTEQQLENFDVKSIPDDADTGYIPKVEYPAAIHDIHSDLTVAPESQAVQVDDLSPYSQHLHETLHIISALTVRIISFVSSISAVIRVTSATVI